MMEFDHIHFYVENAETSRNWFIEKLKFEAAGQVIHSQTHTEVVKNGQVYFLLSSPLSSQSEVADYLRYHPPGVVDVAFQVDNLETMIDRIIKNGGKIVQPIQYHRFDSGLLKWATILGWGGLRHTLVELLKPVRGKRIPQIPFTIKNSPSLTGLEGIDHIVLNVASGALNSAIIEYQILFGLEPQQSFNIQTKRSGLQSQVLSDPNGYVKFPINEPTSPTSQIQEFLDYNQGSGIQHIALKTNNIIHTINQLIPTKLPFLSVPNTYYTQLQKRGIQDCLKSDWENLKKAQILIDWKAQTPEAILLQIFTQPIFTQPTFFFEFIERKVTQINGKLVQASGFGEGNFQALFEAVEQDQLQRILNQSDQNHH